MGLAELFQQLAGMIVVVGGRDEGDVHTLSMMHLVRVHFGKHDLLGYAHRVITISVKTVGIHAAKVANTR